MIISRSPISDHRRGVEEKNRRTCYSLYNLQDVPKLLPPSKNVDIKSRILIMSARETERV